jgi:hypothetical protein
LKPHPFGLEDLDGQAVGGGIPFSQGIDAFCTARDDFGWSEAGFLDVALDELGSVM